MPLMKKPRSTLLAGLAFCLFALSGCASRVVNPALIPVDELHAQATAAFEAGRYGDAIPLLEGFVTYHLGDPRAPQALFNLAQAHMARREFVSAASYFQRLATDFPANPLNVDARMGSCEAYVRLSPRAPLDQEYTRAALGHCESVAMLFPGTPQGEQASEYVTEMQERLAEKIFDTGAFYQRRRALDAAVIYFTDVVTNYPQTSFAPQALARLVEAYDVLGYVEDAEEARTRLLRQYPESPEARTVRGTTSAAQ
jgi:outer membrane protein assembly factor BamD